MALVHLCKDHTFCNSRVRIDRSFSSKHIYIHSHTPSTYAIINMRKHFLFTTVYVGVGTVSAGLSALPLDIPSLLQSLRPASVDDPRFSSFAPPTSSDGLYSGGNIVFSMLIGSQLDRLVQHWTVLALDSNLWLKLAHNILALANHGFINHDGRALTIPHLVKGLSEGLNIGAEVTVALGGAALHTSSNPASGTIDLDGLIAIEHDASISRQDATFGSAQPFNDLTWQQYLTKINRSSTVDVPTASRAKFMRYNDSLTHNPNFKYDARALILSYGENALYLQAMSDPVSGQANLDYVRMLFEQEKLPFELGWKPSRRPITLASVGAMIIRLVASSPQPVPEIGTVIV